MPAPPPDAKCLEGRVLACVPCGEDGAILALEAEEELGPIRASRFFMLKPLERRAPLIPRPYSLYRRRGSVCEFLIKVIGPGTRALASSREGERVRMIGPLGNGWPPLGRGDDETPWVLLAGGVGIAPFPLLVEQATQGFGDDPPFPRERLALVFGAATRSLLYDHEALRRAGARLFVATDDGSAGFRGNTLELLARLQSDGELPERVRLLACGPERMLEAVEELSLARGLEAWLSLETPMGCGVGICNGCPVATRPDGPLGAWPNAKCCVEGPVFSTDAITLRDPGAEHGVPSRHPEPVSEAPHEPALGRSGN